MKAQSLKAQSLRYDPLAVALVFAVNLSSAQTQPRLRIDQIMTAQEFPEAGLTSLTDAQARALDAWLNRYTAAVIGAALQAHAAPAESPLQSHCSPAVETTIAGDINGWEGETIFKLDNGQIWEQAEAGYTYFYAYRPEVTIYQTNSGCRMKVEDQDETVLVRRIK